MLELKNDNGLPFPKEVQDRVNQFIDKLPNINWLKPSKDLKKEDVEKQAKFTIECFGIKASVEYRSIYTDRDWDSALDSAWDSAWDSARASALDSAWDSARASALASARASAWDSAWDSARDSARDSAWDSAWDSALASARASAWDSAWDSARDSAWDSALDSARASAWASARASQEVLIEDNEDFKKKYPNGAFKQLFKLWEMGLYPVGVLKETGTFVIYVPPCSMELPDDFK